MTSVNMGTYNKFKGLYFHEIRNYSFSKLRGRHALRESVRVRSYSVPYSVRM